MACVCWGAIISLTICMLFYLCIKLFYPTYSLSIGSGISLFVLAVFLFVQSFLLIGAGYVKDYTEGINNVVLSLISDAENTVHSMTAGVYNSVNESCNVIGGQVDIATIKNALVAEYPVIEKYIDGWESLHGIASNASPDEIAVAVEYVVNGEINAYIWRRVFWMLGAVALMVLGFCLLSTPGMYASRSYSSREARRSPRARSTRVRHSRSSSY